MEHVEFVECVFCNVRRWHTDADTDLYESRSVVWRRELFWERFRAERVQYAIVYTAEYK